MKKKTGDTPSATLTTMKVDIYTCSCVLCSQDLQKQS